MLENQFTYIYIPIYIIGKYFQLDVSSCCISTDLDVTFYLLERKNKFLGEVIEQKNSIIWQYEKLYGNKE